MKFFRDSYCLAVSACEHFCTNHIITPIYIVVYTRESLSSSFVYHSGKDLYNSICSDVGHKNKMRELMQNLHNAWELPEEKDEKGQEDLEKFNALFENKED